MPARHRDRWSGRDDPRQPGQRRGPRASGSAGRRGRAPSSRRPRPAAARLVRITASSSSSLASRRRARGRRRVASATRWTWQSNRPGSSVPSYVVTGVPSGRSGWPCSTPTIRVAVDQDGRRPQERRTRRRPGPPGTPPCRSLARPPRVRPGSTTEQVAGLAVERLADRGERGEPDRLGALVLEHAQVDDRDPDRLGEGGQRHAARLEQVVEPADDPVRLVDRHQTRPSVSRRSSVPIRNASAMTRTTRATRSQVSIGRDVEVAGHVEGRQRLLRDLDVRDRAQHRHGHRDDRDHPRHQAEPPGAGVEERLPGVGLVQDAAAAGTRPRRPRAR